MHRRATVAQPDQYCKSSLNSPLCCNGRVAGQGVGQSSAGNVEGAISETIGALVESATAQVNRGQIGGGPTS